MTRALSLLTAVSCATFVLLLGCSSPSPPPSGGDEPFPRHEPTRPFFQAREQEAQYTGPGRDDQPPDDLEEIKIGWFGPADPQHPTAGAMWQAATMAIDEANKAGGYRGLPFRLVACWSENPWGTGVKDVSRLVYDEGVWAIAGAPDGPSAHLVEQLTAKARVPFISPVSTDKTVNLANVAWVFSCAPGDHLIAPVLASAIVAEADGGGIIIVAATDHDSRMMTKELLAALNELDSFPTRRLEFSPGSSQFTSQLAAIDTAQPTVVVLVAGSLDSARFVKALRRAELTMTIFSGPGTARRAFVDAAGAPAEGLCFPLLWHERAAGNTSADFAARFAERYGKVPDYTAAYTYDGVKLLLAAIRQAGLNRARIRDAIRELSPREGVTGRITWDPTGQNTRGVSLATIHRGQIIPLPDQ